ncbi:AP-3 complex subunit delta [Metarhizium robertsii ARSEF 23]|uniref:AP-3 complex subunit delta n=1 Tax=Metarhizium robertsii (strain ARSEF 23 / ATCC MYA-3075) TaxID=655844 RepID=E9F3Q6_METRA|nr:AP-3 complex subunit delta [Metarhizium robertsii ARSEF 23]EFY97592.2 AP-3 complex subunit delta [Metarhizium robertsii ARSEF 23]
MYGESTKPRQLRHSPRAGRGNMLNQKLTGAEQGAGKDFIQKNLKDCRAEVRSPDMDVKATALLKLVYLEMLGYDMSWASFHVLEVMSSPKYHQKRVGYLGAVQSFRPDTEVLMLATNLLKKDIGSSTQTVISLPIATLPHVITPSLALSTLPDLLPRLGHSHSNIRKKTLVTLYRLALVYPEALRAAWPKIKERLLDPNEDPSVTAAIVNVVCELGWRRPHDFLPLAPRLFELLVDGGNNWMAIKLIKLFATLTPLEPRLVRKLLPPLTNIIATTPAMSLLYECINGIIQGGILGSTDDTADTDEIATLCVKKLRGMVMINGDPNLKYVALLAFNKIVATHPHLVAEQDDVILDCLDSPDITIRIQALDLVQGIVTGDNLIPVVSRLMKQLKSSAPTKERSQPGIPSFGSGSDSNDEAHVAITEPTKVEKQAPPLPEDYMIDIIRRILFICSKDNYSNVLDFDWYIDVLTQLVRMAPVPRQLDSESTPLSSLSSMDVSGRIGDELRNVAVKVRAMRSTAVSAGFTIVAQLNADTPTGHKVTSGVLSSVAWLLGEYAILLQDPDGTLNSLLQLIPRAARPEVCATSLLAVAKIFATIAGDETRPWTAEWKSRISLLIARILHVAEPLALHPNLEVQERAVEFVELLKLTAEAVSGQPASTDEAFQDSPLLLTQAIPSLFKGSELNSVAQGAQRNVPMAEGLDLDEPIHSNLTNLLSPADLVALDADESDEFEVYYSQRPAPTAISSSAPAISRLADPIDETIGSYQQPASEESYLDADIIARRKAERLERNKDDPYYLPSDEITRESTPIHNILQTSNGPDLDIDSIPIIQLDRDNMATPTAHAGPRPQAKPRQKIVIASDETLEGSDGDSIRQHDSGNNSDILTKAKSKKAKHSLLQVDSSHIGSFSLEGAPANGFDYERKQREEAEMQQAIKEVERLRLEMQRANERIQVAHGVDAQGTIVKKKRTVKKTAEGALGPDGEVKPKKKKKKKVNPAQEPDQTPGQGPEGVGTSSMAETDSMADTAAAGSGAGVTADDVVLPKKKKKTVKKKKMAEIEDLS